MSIDIDISSRVSIIMYEHMIYISSEYHSLRASYISSEYHYICASYIDISSDLLIYHILL